MRTSGIATIPTPHSHLPPPRWVGLVFAVCSAIALAAAFPLAMSKGISHDEHQHIAAGCLVLRHGLSPYADFPYFHTPYLPYFYGHLFRLPGGLLLLARVASALAAAATVGLACTFVYRRLARRDAVLALVAAAAVLALLVFSPVWTRTTGRAWNQEISLLFALLAFFKASEAAENWKRPSAWAIAGVMLGLAVGFRITHAPLAAPLLAWALWSGRWQAGWSRLKAGTWFALGLAAALLPVAWIYARSPDRAWFGMLGFAQANMGYLEAVGKIQSASAELKFQKFLSDFLLLEWPLLGTIGLLIVSVLANRSARATILRSGAGWLALAMPFVLIGAFAPSPTVAHYFYPVLVFATLTIATLLTNLIVAGASRRLPVVFATMIVGVAILTGLDGYDVSRKNSRMSRWTPIRTRDGGLQLGQHLPPGSRIFTLAPLWALEGGFDLDPRLSTGPFAWRVAQTMPEADADRLLLPTIRMLDDKNPPAAFHLGHEKKLESDLLSFAEKNRYTPVREIARGDLWIVPATALAR